MADSRRAIHPAAASAIRSPPPFAQLQETPVDRLVTILANRWAYPSRLQLYQILYAQPRGLLQQLGLLRQGIAATGVAATGVAASVGGRFRGLARRIMVPLRQSGLDLMTGESLMPSTLTPWITVDAAGHRTIDKEYRGVDLRPTRPSYRRRGAAPAFR